MRSVGRRLALFGCSAIVIGACAGITPLKAADQTFNLVWTGINGSTASATGTAVIDTALTTQWFFGIPAWFKSLTFTVTGAATGNGTFTLANFTTILWYQNATPPDFSQNLVSELQEFNLYAATCGVAQPGGTTFFTIATDCGTGDDLLLTSFLLAASAPSSLTALLPQSAPANTFKVANVIDTFVANGGTLPGGFQALYAMTGEQLQSVLPQLTGEANTAVTQSSFSAMNQFFNMVFDPFTERRGGFGAGGGAASFAAESNEPSDETRLAYAAVTPKGAPAMVTKAKAAPYAPAEPRWSVWGGGYGGSATTNGNASAGSNDTTTRTYGFVLGADHRIAPDTLVGFALAGGGTSFGLANGLGGGNSDLFQASIYARQSWGAAYLMGAFGYGWQDVSMSRTVTVAGSDTLDADFNANTFAGRAEGGWRFGSAWTGATPYAAVQIASIKLPGYNESAVSGTNTFALAYDGRTDTQTRSELGARFDHALPVQDAVVVLRGRAAWAHDYDDVSGVNATFLSLPGASFAVNGARPDADSLLISAGAELAMNNGLSLAGTFEGEFSGNTESYAGKGSVRYRW
jgi:outer membrane autotransporter protein